MKNLCHRKRIPALCAALSIVIAFFTTACDDAYAEKTYLAMDTVMEIKIVVKKAMTIERAAHRAGIILR